MSNPLPGVPLIESPLFRLDEADHGFSAEESRIAAALHEKGFAVLDFPDPDINARIDRIRERLGPSYGIDFDDPESDKTIGGRRIQDAWKTDEDVRAIATNQVIIELLSKLYGRPAFPFQTLNFPVGTQQEIHSDSVHFSSLPERFMCGVWLAMEDVLPEAGPLFYLPGSHRWPIVTNSMIGRRGYGSSLSSAQDPYGATWQALRDVNGVQEETFLARRGQALIWCANLLHGGSRQSNCHLTRWSQVTHYYFEECIYYTPAFSDEALGRLDYRRVFAIHDSRPRDSKYLSEIAHGKGRNALRQRLIKAFLKYL